MTGIADLPGPVIRTERLLLRNWTDDDLEPFAAMNADPRVMEHFPALLSRAESDAVALRHRALLDAGEPGVFAVEDDSGFLGFVGLAVPRFEADFTPCVEIGWRLAAHAWGRGYASEAALAVIGHARALGLEELVSFTASTNLRSQRVMQRIGMVLDREFLHPGLPEGHPLAPHVLYRLRVSSNTGPISPDRR